MSASLKLRVRGLLRNIAWLFHLRLPWFLAQRQLARRTARALESDYELAMARQQMTYLLAEVATPAEIEAAARRYIEFSLYEAELRWHPRRSTSRRVEGAEHLVEAHAEGRGVVLHFAHHGFYSGMFGSLRRATGLRMGIVTRDNALGWDVGPALRQHMLVVRRGGELVNAGEGRGVTTRLARGEIVALASDAPGKSHVTMAGHEVFASSGAVWSAREANTPIVVADTYGEGEDAVIRLSPPLYPADFEDPKELLQVLISAHEKAILAAPEATMVPTLTWPRVDPASATSLVKDTSVVVPKPFVKALVHNAIWLFHPRLPWRLAEPMLEKRTEKALANPLYQQLATEQMTHLLGAVATPEEIAEVAERYTRFTMWEAEMRWHPDLFIDQRLEGVEHLEAAKAMGRGVIVNFVHHGLWSAMFGTMQKAGIDHYLVTRAGAGGWNEGPAQRQHFRVIKRGGTWMDVREGRKGIAKRLAEGHLVLIATDVVGSSTVELLGRKVKCSSGAAHAAIAADCPIVTAATWKDDDGELVVRFKPAIMPGDFPDVQTLLQHLIDEHAKAIEAMPEASLMPTVSWVHADEE